MVNKKQPSVVMAAIKEIVIMAIVVFVVRTFLFGLYQVPTGSMETTMLVGERFFADKLSYWFRTPARGEIIAFNEPQYIYSSNPVVALYEKYVGVYWGPINYTKRIIGVPGDHVRGVVEAGKPVVYLNGTKLEEPYVNKYPLIHEYLYDIKELKRMMRLGAMPERYAVLKSYDPAVPYDRQPFYFIHHDRLIPKDFDSQDPFVLEPFVADVVKKDPIKRDSGDFWGIGDEFDVHLGANELWLMGDNRRGSLDCRYFGPAKLDSVHGRIVFRIWSNDSYAGWAIVEMVLHPIKFFKQMRWSRFFNFI